MKRITVKFVQWYNKKYGRTGHLFQNRYLSEAVETDAYLLTVTRYIHQNPIKAKIADELSNYAWSSYNLYLDLKLSIIERNKIMDYFENINKFKDFMESKNQDECLDDNKKIVTDIELKKEIEKIHPNIKFISELDKENRNKIIKNIKNKTKASNRQLSRVLGIGRGIIEKVQ